jgi:hypothetical protein
MSIRVQHIACIVVALFLRGGAVLQQNSDKTNTSDSSRLLVSNHQHLHHRGRSIRAQHHVTSLNSVPHRQHRFMEVAVVDTGSCASLLLHQLILKLKLLISFETKEMKIR